MSDSVDREILDTLAISGDLSYYTFQASQVTQVLSEWRKNVLYGQIAEGPVFEPATLGRDDILIWSYTLQYNPNGVLWRVDPAGRPHPDDYMKFLKQNKIIQRATEQTMDEMKHLLVTSQEEPVSSQSRPNPAEASAQKGDAAIDTTDTQANSDSWESRVASLQPDGTLAFPPVIVEAKRLTTGQYGDARKAQYYLAKLGFNIGKNKEGNPIIDGDLGVLSSSSLIIFQYKAGLKITGKADSDTLATLSDYVQRGMSWKDIIKKPSRELFQYPSDEKGNLLPNGEIHTNTLTRVPNRDGTDAYLYESTAIAWAFMVQTAAVEAPELDMRAFLLNGPVSGYRDLPAQWDMYRKKGGEAAVKAGLVASPGRSPHGWGLAMDINLSASDPEYKWLLQNSERFGFRPYNVEDWHWDYRPEKNMVW